MKLSEEIINSFKDNKEGLGAKRLTTFNLVVVGINLWLLILYCYIIWGKDKYKVELAFECAQNSFYWICIMILLLLAIITVPQVIELINTFRGNKPKDNEQQPNNAA